jgi:hypothetical protein
MTENPTQEPISELEALLDPLRHPTISLEQYARVFGFSRTHAYTLANSDQIPGVLRFGHRMRVPTALVRRMLALDDVTVPTKSDAA